MESRRRRIPLAILTAAPLVVVTPFALANAPSGSSGPSTTGDDPPPAPTATASIVKVEDKRAVRKKVVNRTFRPWSRPTPAQVREIIRNEARRWHVPAASLSRRVACESHYRWWASNGAYSGVLQFSANAFYRGMSTIRTREIMIIRTKSRRVHDARITHYSDGTTVSRNTTPRRQRVVVVLKARLPRNPAISDTFAQIRIGAQALRGISAVHSSEWSCGA
jgi:hypothetical protein